MEKRSGQNESARRRLDALARFIPNDSAPEFTQMPSSLLLMRTLVITASRELLMSIPSVLPMTFIGA